MKTLHEALLLRIAMTRDALIDVEDLAEELGDEKLTLDVEVARAGVLGARDRVERLAVESYPREAVS